MSIQAIANAPNDLLQHAQRVLDELGRQTNIQCKVCGEEASLYDVLERKLIN